jgi:hypothetical protein
MRWVEIITLRSSANINMQLVDEFLDGVSKSDSPTDTPSRLVAIKAYHHSVVETDLSIHLYWESEPGSQNKTPLGLRLSSVLRNLGLLNHSAWVETAAMEFPLDKANHRSEDGVLGITGNQKTGKHPGKEERPFRSNLEKERRRT